MKYNILRFLNKIGICSDRRWKLYTLKVLKEMMKENEEQLIRMKWN